MNQASLKQLDNSRLYPLNLTQELKVGRESSCQIILDSTQYPSISRVHAVFRPLASGDWEVCDLNSANGTLVNGQRLYGCQRLQSGDRITVGQNAVTFLFESAVAGLSDRDRKFQPQTPLRTPVGSAPVPSNNAGISLSQLVPIISTGKDLRSKAFLIPGIVTVIVVVSMFATIGNYRAFASLLALYLAMGGFYVIYQMCGKSKPWWVLLCSAIMTIVFLLIPPLFGLFTFIFRGLLPGNIDLAQNAGFLRNFVAHFFGAGMLEELFKAMPILIFFIIGSWLRSPLRERVGVWEPLDGILIGAASAAGFTLLETLAQYVPDVINRAAQSGRSDSLAIGLQLLIPRILGSVAGHMAYSGYFGYFIGLSILKPKSAWVVLPIGYITAAALHGFWNASSSFSSNENTSLFVTAFVGILSYAFLTASILKARSLSPSRNENFATRLKP